MTPTRMPQVQGTTIVALLIVVIGLFLLPFLTDLGEATYYDNTTVLTILNVTNLAPIITDIVIYDNDTLGGAPNIILTQGVTDMVWCNATITDYNGYLDITDINATFFHESVVNNAPDDNNNHYFNTTCINTTIPGNLTSINIQCAFPVWFYANNGTWSCNITARDKSESFNHSANTRTIDPLFALDLNTTVIDYGELAPGTASADDVPVRVTNFGNMDINVSVEGYGVALHDGLSMNCESGTIDVQYQKYDTQSGETVTNMYNLTTNPMLNGIAGLTIPQQTVDGTNTTNTTFWKIQVPIAQGLKGFCNGTVLYSAIGPA